MPLMAAVECNCSGGQNPLLNAWDASKLDRYEDDASDSKCERCGSGKSSRTTCSSEGLGGEENSNKNSDKSISGRSTENSTNQKSQINSGTTTKPDIGRLFMAKSSNSSLDNENLSQNPTPVTPPPAIRTSAELAALFTASSFRSKLSATSEKCDNDENSSEITAAKSGPVVPLRRKKSVGDQVKSKVSEATWRVEKFRSKIRRKVSKKKIRQGSEGDIGGASDESTDSSDTSKQSTGEEINVQRISEAAGIGLDKDDEDSNADTDTHLGFLDRDCLVIPVIECHENDIDDD